MHVALCSVSIDAWSASSYDGDGTREGLRAHVQKGDVHMAVRYWIGGALVVAASGMPARAELMPQPPPTADAVVPATVTLVETWPDGRLGRYEAWLRRLSPP